MDVDNLLHLRLVRKLNIVKDTAAEKGVRQLFFRIGGNDHDGALSGPNGFLCLRNIEFHLVQLPEQVVGELQVCLVDLVDQEDHLFL